MTSRLGQKTSPIGLAFDGRFFAAVQLFGRGDHWRLVAAARITKLSPGGDIQPEDLLRLGAILSRQGFRGRRVVASLPAGKVLSGVLDLPPRSSGAPLEELARAELSRMHGYDPNRAETACWDLPASSRVKDGTQVMAMACRHEDAEALVTLLEDGRFEPEVLDSPVHALVRACRGQLSGDDLTGILDLGWDRMILCLLYLGEIVYQRTLPTLGVGHLAQSLSSRLSLEAETVDCLLSEVGLEVRETPDAAFEPVERMIRKFLQDLARELKAPLGYARHQYPGAHPDALLVTGFGASIPGVVSAMDGLVDVSVRIMTPDRVVKTAEALRGKAGDASLTLAVGLAMSGND